MASPAQAGVGELDTSFSGDGKVLTDFPSSEWDKASDTVIQPDGKILVVGNASYHLALARYTADGSPDTTFGGGDGMATAPLGVDNAGGPSVALLGNGKIAVAASYSWGSSDQDFAIFRFNANGTLDTSFGGGDGFALFDITDKDFVGDLVVQASGKMVVVGTALNIAANWPQAVLIRFNTDGSLDTTFGDGGFTTATFAGESELHGAALVPKLLFGDERIVVVGQTRPDGGESDFLVARYTADGNLDGAFSGDGFVVTDVANWDELRSVAIQADGRIVVTGKSDYGLAVARYTTQGVLDSSFSGDGIVVSTGGSGVDHEIYGNDLALLPGGQIMVVGTSKVGPQQGRSDFLLARYNSNGSLDVTFGNGGGLTTDFGGRDSAKAVAVQPLGKIVVAGSSEHYELSSFRFSVARYRMTPSGLSLG